MKSVTRFNIGLIENAIQSGYVKPLAMYYQIKAKFKHSIVYNYTPNKLSKLTGLHHKTVKRYVNILTREGLVELHHGNLTFRSAENKGSFRVLPTKPYTSFEGILNRIYYLIVLNNKAKQDYNIAVKYGKNIGSLNARTQKKSIEKCQN